jgi:predicted transcriptional regulator
MEVKEKEIVRTTIELPAALNEKLLIEAERAKRSRHAQMLIALEKFFESPNGNGKKEKTK